MTQDDAHISAQEQLDSTVENISQWLEDADTPRSDITPLTAELDTEDLAEIFNRLPDAKREDFATALDAQDQFDHEILPHLDADAADDVLKALGNQKSAEALAELDTEDAVQVIAELDDDDQQEILDAIEQVDATAMHEVEEGLAYPEESAGRLMRKKMVSIPEFWTVGDTIDHLRGKEDLPGDFYTIFITDPHYKPVGGVMLARIMQSPRADRISQIMDPKIHAQTTHTDQEEVAFDFRKYGLVEAPVVNEQGRLVGTITIDDVVHVMQEEEEEDFLRAGGVSEQDMQDSLMGAVSKRFPWLFINLLTAVAASFIIDLYRDTIEQLVLLAVLMPIVASMGGNAGIQASTIAVRAIATRRIPAGKRFSLIRKEIALGALNGVGIAAITGAAIYTLYHDVTIALVFAASTIVTMMAAGLSGAGLPLLLKRLGADPAISSGVFLTMLTDMVGFFVFLGLASLVVG